MRLGLLFSCAWLFFPVVLFAQNREIDYQLHFLMHRQTTIHRNIGFAGWAIMPDVTVRPRRILVLGGILLKNNRGWLEMMGGRLINAPNGNEAILDARASVRLMRSLNFSGGLSYSFRDQRIIFLQNINVPFSINGFRMSAGVESDVLFPKGRLATYGIGPRLTIQLPPWRRASVTNAYQFRRQRESIFRTYVFVNL